MKLIGFINTSHQPNKPINLINLFKNDFIR